jgi:hypothetical protein
VRSSWTKIFGFELIEHDDVEKRAVHVHSTTGVDVHDARFSKRVVQAPSHDRVVILMT